MREASTEVESAAPAAVTAAYAAAKPGFYAQEVDGRLWVFRNDDMELLTFLETGEPAKSVTMIGAGPKGETLRGPPCVIPQAALVAVHGDGLDVPEPGGSVEPLHVTAVVRQRDEVALPSETTALD